MNNHRQKLEALFSDRKSPTCASNIFERRYNLMDWLNSGTSRKYTMDSLLPFLAEFEKDAAFLKPKLEIEPSAADNLLSFGSFSVTASQFVALAKYASGETLFSSTHISGESTYGFGKLDDLGSWQFQLPELFIRSLGY